MLLSGLGISKVFLRLFTSFPARIHGLVQLRRAIAVKPRAAPKVARHASRERAGQ